MAEPIKIDLKQIDLEFEKEIESQEYYIELHETYLRNVGVYDAKVPVDKDDLFRGYEEVYREFDLRFKREWFTSVEKFWDDKQNVYRIDLEINGYPNTIQVYFAKDDKEECEKVFKILFNWIFNLTT